MPQLSTLVRTIVFALTALVGLGLGGPRAAEGQVFSGDPFAGGAFAAGPPPFFSGGFWNRRPNLTFPSPMVLSERLWIRGEYLYWDSDGMESPALVTTAAAGTPIDDAGVLGVAGTRTLFGGNLNDDEASGLRIRSGFWVTPEQTFAIESEYFALLGGLDDSFNSRGRSETVIARPFFDVGPDAPAQESSRVIRFPGAADGSLAVEVDTDLKSYLINGRVALAPSLPRHANGHRDRIDWIIGYRHLDLDDRIRIDQSTTTDAGSSSATDRFSTSNEFNGLQWGIVHQTHLRRLWVESLIRVAAGNNTQQAHISGRTTTSTAGGGTDSFDGGVLALASNSGGFERDQFTLIPELGFTLGGHVTDWLDLSIGYTVLYYPNVVRAGNIIDTDVNSGLLPPPADPLTGASRPRFRFIESDYLAHGLSLGAELRF